MLVGWGKTLKEDCLDVASGYLRGKKDNTIISFGKTGRSIISRLSRRVMAGTELISVDSGKAGYQNNLLSFFGRRVSLRASEYSDQIGYMRSVSSSPYGGSVTLDFVSGGPDVENLNVDETEFDFKPENTVSRLISSASSSSSFILMSNFGESFAQRMHISAARVLAEKGIPHLNVIAVPRSLSRASLELAKSGVDELREEGMKVITYFEDALFSASSELLSAEFYQMVAKKVSEFSGRLASKANLLKTQILAS